MILPRVEPPTRANIPFSLLLNPHPLARTRWSAQPLKQGPTCLFESGAPQAKISIVQRREDTGSSTLCVLYSMTSPMISSALAPCCAFSSGNQSELPKPVHALVVRAWGWNVCSWCPAAATGFSDCLSTTSLRVVYGIRQSGAQALCFARHSRTFL